MKLVAAKNKKSLWRAFAVIGALVVLGASVPASCIWRRSAAVPIGTLEYIDVSHKNRTLVVLLPGIYDTAGDFEQHGLIQAVKDRRINVDLIAVDAHYGYYATGNVIERLHADVITPALQRGYRNIWLVGVSLGGFGSLLYSKAHPEVVRGVLLISPFLGRPAQSIDPAEWLGERNGEESVWTWLSNYPTNENTLPRVFLAYGKEDKFAETNERLAKLLPPENVLRLSGGHDWRTWKVLWEQMLDRGILL